MTKQLYHKAGGRTYKHFVQSFAPDKEDLLRVFEENARRTEREQTAVIAAREKEIIDRLLAEDEA